MTRLLAYRHTRHLAIWLTLDLTLTLLLAVTVGPAYLAWRAQHPWTLLLTLPALALIAWRHR